MSKRFSSILDELTNTSPNNRDAFVESRAMQVIASYNNLVKLITESYNEETADDLKKRLLLAIKNNDDQKFSRKIENIRRST